MNAISCTDSLRWLTIKTRSRVGTGFKRRKKEYGNHHEPRRGDGSGVDHHWRG